MGVRIDIFIVYKMEMHLCVWVLCGIAIRPIVLSACDTAFTHLSLTHSVVADTHIQHPHSRLQYIDNLIFLHWLIHLRRIENETVIDCMYLLAIYDRQMIHTDIDQRQRAALAVYWCDILLFY